MNELILQLLHRSHVFHIDKNDLELQLISHSAYPSLKAVTDTLDYFGIENIAANVPVDALDQLPENFLALIDEEGETELVLVKRKKTDIHLKTGAGKKVKMPAREFVNKWTGTIIAVEKEEKKEKDAVLKQIDLKLVFAGFAALTVLLTITLNGEIVRALYVLLAFLGLGVSYFTVKSDLGIEDRLVTRVCTAISGKGEGCKGVINSREGKLFNAVGLSDISVIYFAGIMVVQAIAGFDKAFFSLLSLCALPFIAFSLYLQAFKLKQWCSLCIVISSVLISQFVLLSFGSANWDLSLKYLFNAGLIFLMVAGGWYLLKNLWKDRVQYRATLKEFYTFKRNGDLFLSALKSREPMTQNALESHHGLLFGHPKASIRITAITNPLCGFCEEPFKVYSGLLKDQPEEIQLHLIFNVPDNEENKATQIGLKILSLYEQNRAKAFEALEKWFYNRDIDAWLKIYENINISPQAREMAEKQRQWCADQAINYTPETIVNSYYFPKRQYKIEDLRFFTENLRELNVESRKSGTAV
ncbi:hypothetical protein GWK08_13790 [Leptobacterium flavescens]|uniref:Vitamin K epoxide reductase domain-containing protein n=1 Tax=Leptobacterium flavescens TaxID=472055 RepID=A0A6P0UME4_9FLAO|nr:vitamin K epoxide reductase family protein [Leptobacterium flavescens]NER14521.1 hypothetical protein [Leptobacterium flavescens]